MILFARLLHEYVSMTVVEPVEILADLISQHAKNYFPQREAKSASFFSIIRAQRDETVQSQAKDSEYTVIRRPAYC